MKSLPVYVYALLTSLPQAKAVPSQESRFAISRQRRQQFDALVPRPLRGRNRAFVNVSRGGANPARPTVKLKNRGSILWKIPVLAAIASFWSFRVASRSLQRFVDWSTQHKWLPTGDEQINLQTNVITQVINGPVITSISVLFASLVSITISNLQERHMDIQRSLIWEAHQQRILQAMMESAASKACISEMKLVEGVVLVQQHNALLFSHKYSSVSDRADPHEYIESSFPALLQWCQSVLVERQNQPRGRDVNFKLSGSPPEPLLAEIQSLANGIMLERCNRWMALQAVPFPGVHYMTLALLAFSIGVSFLVATAQANVMFAESGLYSVRILWTVLITAFTALGVVCYDLSKPFGGAYHVAGDHENK